MWWKFLILSSWGGEQVSHKLDFITLRVIRKKKKAVSSAMNFLFRLPCPCQEVCLTVFWAFRTTEPGSPEKWVSKSPLSRALGPQGSVPKEGEHTAAAFERKEASAEGLQFLGPVLCQSKGSGEPGSSTRERKPWHLNRWSSRWALLVNKRAVEVVEARDDKCCVVILPHSAHGAWIRKTKQQKKIHFTRIFHVSAFLFAVYTWWWSQRSPETFFCCVCFVSGFGWVFF